MSDREVAKRYRVCRFPSLYGTPWETDSWIVALFWFYTREMFGLCEIRLIDTRTGEHRVR